MKLSKLPFALFYFDYAVSVLVTATLMALTLGDPSVAPKTGQGFLHTMTGGRLGFQQAGLAFAAGVVFNAANMLLVAAIDMVGLAVAFPCSIGLALVLGTVVTYAVQPKGGCCGGLVQRLGTLPVLLTVRSCRDLPPASPTRRLLSVMVAASPCRLAIRRF